MHVTLSLIDNFDIFQSKTFSNVCPVQGVFLKKQMAKAKYFA